MINVRSFIISDHHRLKLFLSHFFTILNDAQKNAQIGFKTKNLRAKYTFEHTA